MARKATGHWPIIEVALAPNRRFVGSDTFTQEQALRVVQEALGEARTFLGRTLGRDYELDFSWRVQSDYVCEHCRHNWTEKSPEYNGGCCDADEANAPNAEAA